MIDLPPIPTVTDSDIFDYGICSADTPGDLPWPESRTYLAIDNEGVFWLMWEAPT